MGRRCRGEFYSILDLKENLEKEKARPAFYVDLNLDQVIHRISRDWGEDVSPFYYYLPAEDQAIHKSVAIYVDKAYRRAASQSNCYTKRKSAYLPLKDKSFTHNVFQRAYKEKEYFFEITEAFLQDKDMQKNYLIQLFQI